MTEATNLTNAQLNNYFENEVKLSRHETSDAREMVLSTVHQVLQFINNEDKRFGKSPMKVGSSFQGLKTKAPDEFDFNILLEHLGEFRMAPTKDFTKRYYGLNKEVDEEYLKTTPQDICIVAKSVPLPNPPEGFVIVSYDKQNCSPIWQNSTDLIFQGDIIPYLVRKQLKGLLQKAIRDLDLKDDLKLGRKVHGPALTLRIPYNQDGIEDISVDFAPTIPNVLKISDVSKWPPANVQWPSKDRKDKVMGVRLNAIAKKPFHWLLSYARCEVVLMEEIDKDGGCRKKAHRIMKRLREDFWCKTNKPVMSSYWLKNILFLECEMYPREQHWESDMLHKRVSSMIDALLQCIKRRHLPLYFNREVNLIKLKDSNEEEILEVERRHIENFANNPSMKLQEKLQLPSMQC